MKVSLTFFFLIFSTFLISQTQISKKDKETFGYFSNELYQGNLEEIEKLIDSTYAISVQENNKILEILMLRILAEISVKKENFNEGDDFFLKQYNKITALNNSYLKDSLLIQNFNNRGYSYLNYGDFPKGVDFFYKSLALSKKINDSTLIGESYDLLGTSYMMQELPDDAVFYYNECLKYDTSLEMKNVVYNNLGIYYTEKKDYKLAEKYLLGSLETTNKNDIYELDMAYVNLAYLYSDMEEHEKAHSLFLKADEYASQLNDKSRELHSKFSLVTSFTNIGDYKTAKKYVEICDSLVAGINSNALKKDLYGTLYINLAKMRDYKTAFEYVEKYMVVHDSIYSIEKTKTIKDLKIKHDVDLKEVEIASQKELIKTKNIQNTVLLIGIGLILISMVSLLFLHKKRLLTQKKLLKKQEELAEEKVNTVLEKQKVRTYESYIDGRDKERKRISQELHDGILGKLYGTRMGLGFVKLEDDKANQQKHNSFLNELQHIEKEIRDVSHKLSSNFEGNEQGFSTTVAQLLEKQSYIGNFDVLLNNSDKIDWNSVSELVKINLYRIIQESLQNIIKHADASKVTLNFHVKESQLMLEIKDNGKGFVKDKVGDGIGIKNITSRVEAIKGVLHIESEENQGTSMQVQIPEYLVA